MNADNWIEPNDLLLFACVADAGSFSRAGERLGLPKSTVSRRLAALEARLGERLLLRTTRKLSLTDMGHSVLEHAQQVKAEAEAAASLAQHRQQQPSGRLRVSMPSDVAHMVLASLLAEFVAQHPAITLEVDLSARRVDLIGENFDLAIRMGDLTDDASLAARRLADFSVSLVAAPAYLQRRGTPLEPAALLQHDGLLLLARNGEPRPWVLSCGEQRWEGLPPARVTANSPELLVRLACAGSGITGVTDHYAEPYLRSGELVAVLPDWHLPAAPAWAVFPGRRLMPARTRVFLDALQARLSGPACRAYDQQVQQGRRERAAAAQPAPRAA